MGGFVLRCPPRRPSGADSLLIYNNRWFAPASGGLISISPPGFRKNAQASGFAGDASHSWNCGPYTPGERLKRILHRLHISRPSPEGSRILAGGASHRIRTTQNHKPRQGLSEGLHVAVAVSFSDAPPGLTFSLSNNRWFAPPANFHQPSGLQEECTGKPEFAGNPSHRAHATHTRENDLRE